MLDAVKREFRSAQDIEIASGYISHDIISEFEEDFYRVAKNKGKFKLLVGMAFYEGLAARNLRHLSQIDEKLNGISKESGVFVAYSRRYHGKIYSFKDKDNTNIYVGSSNFSWSGLSENLECTTLVKDAETQKQIAGYLAFLFHPDNAASIRSADITVLGSAQYQQRVALETLSDLERYDPASIDKTKLKYFTYSLSRKVGKEKSNLNVYFGKGRWSRATGKVKPRDWYEVELIANKDVRSSPIYPKGDFIAYTDDGYIMHMYTGGDYNKNIRTRDNLKILGQWIKSKLQNANALLPLTPVTADTLEQYGKDSIKFYKIKDGEYYIEF